MEKGSRDVERQVGLVLTINTKGASPFPSYRLEEKLTVL